MAMMDQMKKIQAQGGNMNDFMAQMAKNRPQGDQKPANQGNPPPQGSKDTKPGQDAPPPGFGPKDPKIQAELLKTSLEGIRQSAEYLIKSDFVK
jgi:hypothetical protein